MYKPRISVVIPVYNGENYLKEAIDSALNQTYENVEVLVVDDGSVDGTREIMDAYGDRIIGLHKKIGGVATALNMGIAHMSGEYFAWLSHDDLMKPDACEIYVRHLQGEEKETLVYGNYDILDKEGRVYNWTNFEALYTQEVMEMSVYPVILGCVNGCALLVHRSHFDRVGYFNEELKITQDNEMWFRIFRDSKIKFCGETVSSKRYHPQQDSQTKDIYPDEDAFVFACLRQLNLVECACFGGNVLSFFRKMKARVSPEKHPLTTKFCGEMICKAQNGSLYSELTAEELTRMLMAAEQKNDELEKENRRLQGKLRELYMKF